MMKSPFPFENRLDRTQTILGLIYFPLHVVVLPLLFALYGQFSLNLDEVQANLIYYCIGVGFVLIFMMRFLRDSFDVLMDRLSFCIVTIVMAMMLNYGMSYIVAIIIMLVTNDFINPNTAEIISMAGTDYGAIRAIAIFMAPIVEEVLFRGVIFGAVRERNRVAAYVLSIVLFCLYHVWQPVMATGDLKLLLYAVQYVPVSFALAWAYERSGSIWTTIFFHMIFNGMAFKAMDLLQSMM